MLRRREERPHIQSQVFRFLVGILVALSVRGAGEDRPFNHKKHAQLKLKCTSCHKEAETSDRAGFPLLAQCKSCHLDFPERKIPLQLVHELPDFVFFGHRTHAVAKVGCASCHGDIAAQEAASLQQPLKMKWCVDCHKQNTAAVGCNTCHELGQ